MQKDEITAYVINSLGRHRNRNDIIHHLCERAGLTWPQAEKIVRHIEANHSHEISSRQSPVVIGLAVMTILAGLGLIGYTMFFFVSLAQRDTLAMVESGRGVLYALVALFTGVCMIVGGLISLRKTIQGLFEDRDHR